MKVAITGGTGFLGKHVIDSLKTEGYVPVILTRSQQQNEFIDCELRYTDYSNEALVEDLIDIDAVIHLAAKRGSQGLISDFHENEVMTQNLYTTCLNLGISNIIFASSISVYSDKSTIPWTERNIPSPNLMYGISKLANEHIGNIYSTKGLFVKNIRLAHLYGFNEKNNYMINLFFRQAFNKEKLVLNTNSTAKREFLYVKDAAKAIICALRREKVAGTFNVGSGNALTNFEVAQNINEVFLNNNNLLIKHPEMEDKTQPSYFDSTYAKNKLYFSCDYTFVSALSDIYNLMRGLDHVPIRY
ncbi:SDR family oxidoreductase [Ornithinibacillus gellani]|nr:SDR family oxidoreductase [Ornithinibacillus gellani]